MTTEKHQGDSKKKDETNKATRRMQFIQPFPDSDEDFYGAVKSDSCKADIPEEDLAKWAPLLTPFKKWHPAVCNGEQDVIEITLNKFEKFDRTKKYDMTPKLLIGMPHPDMFDAYLWKFKEKESKDLDKIDRLLWTKPLEFEKRVFYILHSYGGYWQFFRPSFDEIAATLRDAGLDPSHYHRVYSTTVGMSQSAGSAYSAKYDKNRGITTVYMLPKSFDLTTLDESTTVEETVKMELGSDEISKIDISSRDSLVTMTRVSAPGGPLIS